MERIKKERELVLAEIGIGVNILIILIGIALICNRVFAFSDSDDQTPNIPVTTVSTTTIPVTTVSTTTTTTTTTITTTTTTTITTTTTATTTATTTQIALSTSSKEVDSLETEETSEYEGKVLTPMLGVVQGPSGKETFYNKPMGGVIEKMEECGFHYEYWIRSDGVKMYGDYVMVAADLSIRPRGSIVDTTLGTGIVCDTGEFIYCDPYQLDIAVNW